LRHITLATDRESATSPRKIAPEDPSMRPKLIFTADAVCFRACSTSLMAKARRASRSLQRMLLGASATASLASSRALGKSPAAA